MDRNSHINFGILPNRPKLVYVLIVIPEDCDETMNTQKTHKTNTKCMSTISQDDAPHHLKGS